MKTAKTSVKLGGNELHLEIGRFAQQASAAVLARLGDTVVHATIVMGKPVDLGYFPLQVEYQEKLYAGGKIKGSRWVKRDGRPSDEAVLKARLIDRSIRPLFPEGMTNEVQVVVTVLSADGENDADIPAMFAVSVGLALSKIPWQGPIGAVRMGLDPDGKLIINPTYQERETSGLDLVISGSQEAVVMLEAGASEVQEAQMLEAFQTAHAAIASALKDLTPFIEENAQDKTTFTPATLEDKFLNQVKKDAGTKITNFVKAWAKLEPFDKDLLIEELAEKYGDTADKKDIAEAIYQLMKKEARRLTSQTGSRPDGRKTDEIRPISCEVGVLPRTHGSGMFLRGSTQALTITTLGSPSLNQLIESMEGEEEKRYIHHYYMPPFSVGETGRMGWPSRREVGHGALAERALQPMIPELDDFPYTIQVVSEIMSSNGSTSMASVCGSTLSLMDAGVPLKKPVSGIAMGLIKEGDDYLVLSDIQGLEDFTGDMDFKVAGTRDGITAMQMDIKISGIPLEVLSRALNQAKIGRLFIMDKMLAVLPEPRTKLSPYAPKIVIVTVPVDKIGEIIGPGGKIIKNIIAETGAEVDIDDDGKVFISSTDDDAINKAKNWVTDLVREIKTGEEFEGKVVRIENYGAFVNILPGRDGLLHVSNMSMEFVSDVNQLVKMGDTLKVRVNEIDDSGKIGLTTLTPEQQAQKRQSGGGRDQGGRGRSGGGYRDRRDNRDFRPRR